MRSSPQFWLTYSSRRNAQLLWTSTETSLVCIDAVSDLCSNAEVNCPTEMKEIEVILARGGMAVRIDNHNILPVREDIRVDFVQERLSSQVIGIAAAAPIPKHGALNHDKQHAAGNCGA